MADHLTTPTFAELEFVLRSTAGGADRRASVLRLRALRTADRDSGTVLVRSAADGAEEVGLAVARGSGGAWFVSDVRDRLDRPEVSRRVTREALVARIIELLAQPVGV